jgi:hypothetical protein
MRERGDWEDLQRLLRAATWTGARFSSSDWLRIVFTSIPLSYSNVGELMEGAGRESTDDRKSLRRGRGSSFLASGNALRDI